MSNLKKTVIVFVLVLSFIATTIYINAATDKPETLEELDKKISELNKNIDKFNDTNEKFDESKLSNEKEIKDLTGEINAIRTEISQIDSKLKQSEENYNKQSKVFSKRFLVMYQNFEGSLSAFQLLLSSTSIEEFIDKYQMMTFITNEDKKVLNNYRMAKLEVENSKKMKEDMVSLNQDSINSNNKKIKQIVSDKKDIQNNIDQINKDIAFMNSLESEMLSESINITYALSKVTGGEYVGGDMRWPVPNYKSITSPYGYRLHPISGEYKMHEGIDISANAGASILSANAGKVIEAEYKSGYGNTVVVDHGGGITTLYAHCSSILSNVGQGVEAGKVIAAVGSTGSSTGNHLHFEVRVNGITKNPLNYVSQP